MRHIHPSVNFGHHKHLKHTGDSDTSDSESDDEESTAGSMNEAGAAAAGSSSTNADGESPNVRNSITSPRRWFGARGGKKNKNKLPAKASKKDSMFSEINEDPSQDNGAQVLAALEAAVAGAMKYKGRDHEITVGDERADEEGGHHGAARLGLLAFAEQRIAKLKKKYPHLKAAVASMSSSSSSSSSSMKSPTGQGVKNSSMAPLSPNVVNKPSSFQENMNPITGISQDSDSEEEDNNKRVVNTQPGKPIKKNVDDDDDGGWSSAIFEGSPRSAPSVAAPAEAAAAVDEGGVSNFTSFLFDNKKVVTDKSQKQDTAAAAEGAGGGGGKMPRVSKLPGSIVKTESLKESHRISTEKVDQNRKELRKFLVDAKFGEFYQK
jgi:hypothetical protein